MFLAASEQVDHLGDPAFAFVGAAFRCVDPSEERAPVELGEPVEECAGRRVGGERGAYVVGEFVALGAFGRQHNFDRVTGTDVAVASPRGAEHDSETVTERLNGGSHVHAVDGAVDPVVGLDTPHDVWIERHRDHDPIALTGGDDGRVGARLGHDRDDRPMVSAGRRECGGELRGGG